MTTQQIGATRLAEIVGFHIDRVAAAAGADPDVLRLENLDTDVPPPPEAIAATRAAVGTDVANSWLPFSGRDDLKHAVAAQIARRGGPVYDGPREIVITCGEGDAMLDALFCVTDPGDEVILTDPTYAGMVNRVRLVGAVPRFIPLLASTGEWRLDLDALRDAVTERTRAVFINNVSFPSGWVASRLELEEVASVCRDHDMWLINFASFEGVLYDGRSVANPASLDGMRDRTLTIGSVSLEQRMIGWRVGWVVAPDKLADQVATVHSYNGLVASGFAQLGALAALNALDDGLAAANAEWQRRRDEMLNQLAGLPVTPPSGAWSMLLDVASLGTDPLEMSNRLIEQRVAATPMVGWGDQVAARHVRFVFSNEPVERFAGLGDRVRRALAASLGSSSKRAG
jgi:aspartate/methionine/tyrosine aminotransferase